MNSSLDYLVKKRILSAYDCLSILFEKELKMKKEQDFWKEFFKNQIKNNTEITGGYKPIYFTNEEEKLIKVEKDKRAQLLAIKLEKEKKNKKIGKINEQLEYHRNYLTPYLGPCLDVAEYDYKDKIIKKTAVALSERQEFNKKEIANFIENMNNYSIRKLENINYMSSDDFSMRISRIKPSRMNTISENMIVDDSLINSNTKFPNTLKRLDEMKKDRLQNNTNLVSETSKDEKMKVLMRIRDQIQSNSKINEHKQIEEKEEFDLEDFKRKFCLFKDLIFIKYTMSSNELKDEQLKHKIQMIKNSCSSLINIILKKEKELRSKDNRIINVNLDFFKSALSSYNK